MKSENTLYDLYLASIYKWGMITLICACICADIVYTTMKVIGMYPTVSWTALILFDMMDAIFALVAFFIVKASVKNGSISEKKLREGKIFAFCVLLIQWNYILYMIPSNNFWGLLSFFIILICFFLDLRMILTFGVTLILSLFIAWFTNGNSLLPKEMLLADQVVCTIALFLSLIGIFIFVYFMTHMQWLRKQDEKHLKMQSKYFQELLEKEEGMRSFRHDVNKHMYALDALCKEGKLEQVQNYISDLVQEVQEYTSIRTGNHITDCFFNAAIEELKKTGDIHYEVVGRFPEKMEVSNNDLCVLFANAVENAKEALEKVEGERTLELTIRNHQEKVFITLKNTAKPEDNNKTKKDRNLHGYGLRNMRLVVEKYNGTIRWEQREDVFELYITI